jgi:hypothetical protein
MPELYDRAKLGAWIQANHPAAYVPGGPIKLRAVKGEQGELLAEITDWPEELGAPPTPEQVAAYTPSPVPAVTAALAARERQAAEAITSLKATAAVALVMGGMSEPEAYVAGSALVVEHSAQIQAFILAGGNPVAAQALLDAITANPPAWWSEPMEAIFAAGLGI